MYFRQLESFVEIAKQNSFTKAAEVLYLSQPTLTGHIQILEGKLKTVLFNRSGKNVTLTEAGEILYNHAVNILNLREQAFYCLSQYQGKLQGELAIGASTVLQNYVLPRLLTDFNNEYPSVCFELKHFDSEAVIRAITFGSMDFGFIGTDVVNPDLEMCPIGSDRLILITAPDISLVGRGLSVDEILNMRIIIRELGSATRGLFQQALEKKGLGLEDLNVVAKIENPETIKKCVRAGLGVAILSEQVVQEDIKFGLLNGYTFDDLDLTRNFYFVSHKKRVLNPMARVFKEFTQDYFKEAP